VLQIENRKVVGNFVFFFWLCRHRSQLREQSVLVVLEAVKRNFTRAIGLCSCALELPGIRFISERASLSEVRV